MAKAEVPVTAAVRFLREKGIPFEPRPYPYVERGGTTHAAECLKVSEHEVIKTLIMETDSKSPMIVLMHGDREVSTRQLARAFDTRSVAPCTEATAQRLTGYTVGGISPFGTRTSLPVYVEAGIFSLKSIHINGGRRGFLVRIDPADLRRAFKLTEVSVAISE